MAQLLQPNSEFAGYKVIGVLGHSNATVYRVWNSLIRREEALKVMPDADVADPGLVDRFIDDAALAARIHHPNVVTIFHVGREGDVPYFTMELLSGESLEKRLERGDYPTKVEATQIIRQAAEALDAAHAVSVIHRDVKPGNIIVTGSGEKISAKVIDFGIARDTERSTKTENGLFLGSPDYVSPEVAKGEAITPKADQYSLAAVAYQLLCKRQIFEPRRGVAAVNAHAYEQPTDPAQFGVSADARRALLKALSKSPHDRYPTCKEFADALLAGAGEKPPEPVPPNGAKIFLSLVAVVGVLFIFAGFIRGRNDPGSTSTGSTSTGSTAGFSSGTTSTTGLSTTSATSTAGSGTTAAPGTTGVSSTSGATTTSSGGLTGLSSSPTTGSVTTGSVSTATTSSGPGTTTTYPGVERNPGTTGPVICIDPFSVYDFKDPYKSVWLTSDADDATWILALDVKQALLPLGYGVVMSEATHDSLATPEQRADVASFRGAAMVLQLLIEEGGSEYGFATYHCGFPHTSGTSVGPSQSLIDSTRRMSFAFQKAAAASLGSSFRDMGVLTDTSASNLYSDPIAPFLEVPLLQADFKVVSTDVSTGPKRLSMADAIAKGVVEAVKNR